MPHGTVRYYYLDGALAAEATYQKGVREGETAYFYPNGNTRGTGNYRQDQQVGKWQWWYANKKPRLVQDYPDAVKPNQPDPAPGTGPKVSGIPPVRWSSPTARGRT